MDLYYTRQLFSDTTDSTDTTGPAPATAPTTETKPAETTESKTYTEEDFNKRLEQLNNEWAEKFDKTINKKYAKWAERKDKEISEARKLAEMDATQKAEYERDKLQKELDDLRAEKARTELQTQARKVLRDDGVTVPDSIVSLLVTDDAETTNTAIQAFADAYKQAVRDGVEQSLKHGAPKTGTGASTLTKEQILKVADRKERQKLISENLDLFR